MGLFRKKNQEPVPEPPRVVPINQDNWHEWAALAKGAMGEADMPKAVGYWVDAIARFDSPAAQYRKFHEDVMELVIAHMHKEIAEGKVIQAQMLCELDNKVAEVIPELQTTTFSDDLFYYIKENISAADGPATSARLYVCAAYAVLGYLRFSADMKVSVEKCQEASKLGIYAREQCLSYEKGKYAGALKPQPAAEFVEAFAVFYEEVQKALENALSSMSAEELEALADYRRSHVIDRIDSIGSAMQYCIHSTGRSARKKNKMGAECTAKIAQYIEASLDMNS